MEAAFGIVRERGMEEIRQAVMERARQFHDYSYVFAHGLAAMVNSGFISWDEEEMIRLLRRQYRALRLSFETPEEQE